MSNSWQFVFKNILSYSSVDRLFLMLRLVGYGAFAQGDDHHFGLHAQTEGYQCANARGDVELMVYVVVVQAAPLIVGQRGWRPSEEGQLAAMGVTAERQLRHDVVLKDGAVPGCGVVLEHEDEGIGLDAV